MAIKRNRRGFLDGVTKIMMYIEKLGKEVEILKITIPEFDDEVIYQKDSTTDKTDMDK